MWFDLPLQVLGGYEASPWQNKTFLGNPEPGGDHHLVPGVVPPTNILLHYKDIQVL